MTSPQPCPWCGSEPRELHSFRGPREWLSTCTCYPRPPRCVSCGRNLTDGRCTGWDCEVAGVVQPSPDEDAAYDPKLHGGVR